MARKGCAGRLGNIRWCALKSVLPIDFLSIPRLAPGMVLTAQFAEKMPTLAEAIATRKKEMNDGKHREKTLDAGQQILLDKG